MEIFLCHKKKGCVKMTGSEEIFGNCRNFVELSRAEWMHLLRIIKNNLRDIMSKDIYKLNISNNYHMIKNPYELFLEALSNKTRFEIIELLKKGPKSVNEIVKELGFEQSRVSHNLKCLVDCGFVDVTPNGKQRIYSLDNKTISPILKLVDKHIKRYHNHLKKCGVLEGK